MKQRINMIRQLLHDGIRAVSEKDRICYISFSSEEPCKRFFGTEILDHSFGCVDLTRLKEIGVVLFNHDRDRVLGKIIKADIVLDRGIATIQFDDDKESDEIYQKVKNGTLKGVSIGYAVKEWEEVQAGKTSLDGRFIGPCSIAKKWMPYEISIVSIPADMTVGVGRSMKNNLYGCEQVMKENKRILNNL